MRVLEPPGGSGNYRLLVISGRSSSSCTGYGGYEVQRTGPYGIAVEVFHYVHAPLGGICTMDWITDETLVPLGSGFETGSEYAVTVNGDTSVLFVAR